MNRRHSLLGICIEKEQFDIRYGINLVSYQSVNLLDSPWVWYFALIKVELDLRVLIEVWARGCASSFDRGWNFNLLDMFKLLKGGSLSYKVAARYYSYVEEQILHSLMLIKDKVYKLL